MTHKFDVITIGRSSVDLYGAQVGGRLEEMGSFNKYIGGSPTNIACGTARLGLKSAIITAVAAQQPFVSGFAVGRTIFAESAKSWMSGKIDDSQAIHEMSQKFKRLCDLWDAAYFK